MATGSRTKERRTLHFDLTHLPDHDDLTLHVGGRRHKLHAHTEETLRQARQNNRLLAQLPPERITHHAPDLVLPADALQLLYVTSSKRPEGAALDTLAHVMVHVPVEEREARLRHRRDRERALNQPPAPHPKLMMYGIGAPSADPSEQIDYDKLILEGDDVQTAMDIATTLVLHHPEMLSLNATIAALAMSYIEYAPGISDLARSIYEQAYAHSQDSTQLNWANSKPATGPDLTTPDPTRHTYQWSDATRASVCAPNVPGPLKAALQFTKDDAALQNWSYVVQHGTTCVGNETQAPPRMLARFDRPSPRLGTGSPDTTSWLLRDVTPKCGVEYSEVGFENGKFSISLTNDWIRWLSVYAQFVGPDGRPVAPEGWQSFVPGGLSSVFESDTRKYLNLASARDTILGIPLRATPTEISFPWPTNNPAGVQFLCGGLGAWRGVVEGQEVGNWNSQVCTLGAVLTGILNFGLPIFFLAAGAAFSWAEEMDEDVKEALETLLTTIRVLIEGPMASTLAGGEAQTLLAALANCAIDLLLKALPEVFEKLMAELAAEEIADAIPFVGWIAEAISVAADVALLTETTVEVLMSAATIQIDANKVMDVTVTVHPDPGSAGGAQWPSQTDHYLATLQYTDGTSYQKTAPLDPETQTGPIQVTFSSVPAGGSVKAIFAVYSAAPANWLCGRGETDFIPAPIDGGALSIPIPGSAGDPFRIAQMLVPLTANTIYDFKGTLVYDGAHHWAFPPAVTAPTATGPLEKSPIGNNLASLVDINFSQATGVLGYVWQASGLNLPDCAGGPQPSLPFAFQNITVLTKPEQLLQGPSCGFDTQPYLVYDLLGPKSGTGKNYYFDPRNGGNHLRQVILDGVTPFNMEPGRSWGRFAQQMDSLAIHPAGYAVGINTANHKLEILQLVSEPVPDASAPYAVIKGGLGARPGLLHSPLAVAATIDGRILILDQAFTNTELNAPARIQALDVYGNPVLCFAGSTSAEMALKAEAAAVTYLDMGVESKGYIYVLKVVGDPSIPKGYALDIYQPDGTFLAQTTGVSAGKMVVSLWRDVYTLNYEVIAGPRGTEPSVSWWSPPAPS